MQYVVLVVSGLAILYKAEMFRRGKIALDIASYELGMLAGLAVAGALAASKVFGFDSDISLLVVTAGYVGAFAMLAVKRRRSRCGHELETRR